MFVAFFATSSKELVMDGHRVVSKCVMRSKLSFSANAADETWFKPMRAIHEK
jgi:hypothetical protein